MSKYMVKLGTCIRGLIGCGLGLAFYWMCDEEWVQGHRGFVVLGMAVYIFIWTLYGDKVVGKMVAKLGRKHTENRRRKR